MQLNNYTVDKIKFYYTLACYKWDLVSSICSFIYVMIYDMIKYDMIWYDMIYDMIRYDMIWYDMIWYTIWYDII